MKITCENTTSRQNSLFFLKFSATVAILITLMLAIRFVAKLANVAVESGLVSAIIFPVTDVLVQPFTFIMAPVTFSSGAMVELSSLLLLLGFVSLSTALLWRLHLCIIEPLRVHCIRV